VGTRSAESEPRVVVCLYDLTRWYLERTNRYPKNWRRTLGDKIDELLLEMLAVAHQARMRRDKRDLLRDLSEKLEILRVLTRLSQDVKCLEVRQYEYVSREIDEIGRQIGGWMKQQRGKGVRRREDVEAAVS